MPSTHLPPLRQGDPPPNMLHSSILLSQSLPLNPGRQSHRKSPTSFTQVAPFLHGDSKHSSISSSQNLPLIRRSREIKGWCKYTVGCNSNRLVFCLNDWLSMEGFWTKVNHFCWFLKSWCMFLPSILLDWAAHNSTNCCEMWWRNCVRGKDAHEFDRLVTMGMNAINSLVTATFSSFVTECF